jgi:hypothetical protein
MHHVFQDEFPVDEIRVVIAAMRGGELPLSETLRAGWVAAEYFVGLGLSALPQVATTHNLPSQNVVESATGSGPSKFTDEEVCNYLETMVAMSESEVMPMRAALPIAWKTIVKTILSFILTLL